MSSVPAVHSNPGLNLQGACFDLDDLQAMVEDYEGRLAEEQARREKAERELHGCLAQIGALEGELAKVKNIVMGALVKVQASAPVTPAALAAPAPVAPPPTQVSSKRAPAAVAMPVATPPPTSWAARVPPAPMPKSATTTKQAVGKIALKSQPRPAASAPNPRPAAAPAPVPAPRALAKEPSPSSTSSTNLPRVPAPAADHGAKPKRRIMRSRR